MLLWVPGHCGIQSNQDTDVLAMERLSSPFLGPKLAISNSCVCRFNVKEWLQQRHSEHWAAAPGMRQLKHFIGRSSDKLSRDLLALDTK
jgi:hypothetical protein